MTSKQYAGIIILLLVAIGFIAFGNLGRPTKTEIPFPTTPTPARDLPTATPTPAPTPTPTPHAIEWATATVQDGALRTIELGLRDDHFVVWRVKIEPTPTPPPEALAPTP